jgi:antitoxin HicB
MGSLPTAEDYDCILRKSGSGEKWIAEYPDIPGLSLEGSTKAEAIAKAEVVLSQWLKHAADLNLAIPAPGEARSASGEFKLRLPRSLHAHLATLAEEMDLSLNELNIRFLTAAVTRTVTGNADFACVGSAPGAQRNRPFPMRPVQEYSGTFVQRTSRILHLHLQRLAEAEGTSLNAFAIHLLSYELGALTALRTQALSAERPRVAA